MMRYWRHMPIPETHKIIMEFLSPIMTTFAIQYKPLGGLNYLIICTRFP